MKDDFWAIERSDVDLEEWIDSQLQHVAANGNAAGGTDGRLQALKMSLELGVADISDEVDSLISQVIESGPNLISCISSINSEIETCKSRLNVLLTELVHLNSTQQENLAFLSQIDGVKSNLETCRKVLTDIQQWEFRVREIEALFASSSSASQAAGHGASSYSMRKMESIDEDAEGSKLGGRQSALGGGLGQALQHLAAMKEASAVLNLVPEYQHRVKEVAKLDSELLSLTRRRLTSAVRYNDPKEMHQCAEVYCRMESPGEIVRLISEVLSAEICGPLWKSIWESTGYAGATQGGGLPASTESPGSSPRASSASSLEASAPKNVIREDEAVLKYYEKLCELLDGRARIIAVAVEGATSAAAAVPSACSRPTHASEPSLPTAASGDCQQLDQPSSTSTTSVLTVLMCCVEAAVEIPNADIARLLRRISELPEPIQICDRLLRAYDIGTNLLATTPMVAECEGDAKGSLWKQLCDRCDFIPPSLFAGFACVLRDELLNALANCPRMDKPRGIPQWLVDVEEEASEVYRAVSSFGSILHDSSACIMAPILLAVADAQLEGYYTRWLKLLNLFHSTVIQRADQRNGAGEGLRQVDSALEGGTSDDAESESASGVVGPTPVDLGLLSGCLQLRELLEAETQQYESAKGEVWMRAFQIWHRPSRLNAYLRRFLERHGIPKTPSETEAIRALRALQESDARQLQNSSLVAKNSHAADRWIFEKSASQMETLKQASDRLIIHCAAYPVNVTLRHYPILGVWSELEPSEPPLGRTASVSSTAELHPQQQSPSAYVTAVGESLLALVPHLDACISAADTGRDHTAPALWLPRILCEVEEVYLDQTEKISKLSTRGVSQLLVDASYVARAVETLGGEGSKVGSFLGALERIVGSKSVEKSSPTELEVTLSESLNKRIIR